MLLRLDVHTLPSPSRNFWRPDAKKMLAKVPIAQDDSGP